MQNEEQELGHPYNAIGELHLRWRRKRKGVIEEGETWATGFPVGNGLFVATAAHLVWEEGLIKVEAEYLIGGRTIPVNWVSGNPQYCDFGGAPAVYDVAVARLGERVDGALTLKCISGNLNNKKCIAAGYVKRTLRLQNFVVPSWPIQGETLGGPLKYALGLTTYGMSGGPIIDADDGSVIGIISGDNDIDGFAAPLVSGQQGAAYDFLTEVMRTDRPVRMF